MEEADLNEGLSEAPVQLSAIELELKKYLNMIPRPADTDAASHVEMVPFLVYLHNQLLHLFPASSESSEEFFLLLEILCCTKELGFLLFLLFLSRR